MNVASTDIVARRALLAELRGSAVALRSRMDRVDIAEVEIVPCADFDIAATRQVIKVSAAPDCTGEIDAADVLESVDIVDRARPATPMPLAVPWLPDWNEDAYFSLPEHIATGATTYSLSDELEPEPTRLPVDERRRWLGWIVGTVVAAAAALVLGAVIAEHFPRSGEPAVVAASPRAPSKNDARHVAPPPPLAPPTIDVKSLPTATLGTIVGPARRAISVDGARESGTTALVACGKHVVHVGRSSRPRTVDVPCGGQVVVR